MKLHYRSLWISDIHLGTRSCKAAELLEFLDHVEADTVYLVGDIIDLWKLRSRIYWPDEHNNVLKRFLQIARQGKRVIYIPGNHDRLFREYVGSNFNGIELKMDAVHETPDGRRYQVIHGDQYDHLVCENKYLSYIGGEVYEVLVMINRLFNRLRSILGYDYWSLASYLKHKVKNAVNFMENFRHILSLEAQKLGVDGVICGHVHHADLTRLEHDEVYGNCGDWVESCTALTEDFDGNLKLVHWLEERERIQNGAEQSIATFGRQAA